MTYMTAKVQICNTTENPINERGHPLPSFGRARLIGHEAALRRKGGLGRDGRQSVGGCQRR